MAVFALEGPPVTLAAHDGQLAAVWHSTVPSSPKDQVKALPDLVVLLLLRPIVFDPPTSENPMPIRPYAHSFESRHALSYGRIVLTDFPQSLVHDIALLG